MTEKDPERQGRLLRFWILGMILVIFLLYGVRLEVRREARQVARTAATKVQKARDEVEATQKITQYKARVDGCNAANALLANIQSNAESVKDVWRTLADSRRVAAANEPNEELKDHDLEQALKYEQKIKTVSDISQYDCNLIPKPQNEG